MPDKRQYKQNRFACQGGERGGRPSLPALGLGALLAGIGLALGTYGYAYSATHPRRRKLRRDPGGQGLEYEPVAFSSADGLRLSGWLIPAPEPKGAVIVCHGYPNNRAEMLPYAEFLHRAGYATLLFDFRAHGESEGALCSVGHHETDDLRGALDYLASRPDTASLPVGALGLSLGGAVSLLTAAEDARIRAVVAEASFPTLKHAIEARCRAVVGPLSPVVSHPVGWWSGRWVPVRPREVAPIEAIGRIAPRAVLIIQGQKDALVRWRDAVEMFAAAGEPRELWLLPRSGHARCLADAPEEYARRVTAFFDRYLQGDNP